MAWEKVGVDQSKKIHDNNDTAIVVCPLRSEDIEDHSSVYIPSSVIDSVKRDIGRQYKQNGKTWQFNPRLFSIGVFYALRDHVDSVDQVFLEREFTGNMDFVINTVRNWLRDETPGTAYPLDQDQFSIHSRRHNERANKIARMVRERTLEPDMKLKEYHFRRKM